jgi:hypothetical protein
MKVGTCLSSDSGLPVMKWLVSLLPFLMPFAFVVPCAGAQTSDDVLGDAAETTEDTLGDLPQPGSLGDSTDGLSDTSSATEQTATDAAGGSRRSSRNEADGTASPGKAFPSKFDRLPPRLERLLERIELGRNVRANLRRLEQTLASASVRERARLLRRLKAEVRRLRADGVSPADRRRIDRLFRARAKVAALGAPTPTSAVVDATTGNSATGLTPRAGAPVAAGVLEVSLAGSKAPPREAAPPPREGARGPPGLAETPDGGGFPLDEVLLALCALLLVVVGGLAIKEERAP